MLLLEMLDKFNILTDKHCIYMEIFPNLRESMLNLSYALDNAPTFLANAHILGITAFADPTSEASKKILTEMGFTLNDNLYQRNQEIYAIGASPMGDFTTEEWDAWRKHLIERCINTSSYVCLPSAQSMITANQELIKEIFNHLLNIPSLRIVFHKPSEAHTEAALYTAIDLLSWSQAGRILAEEMCINKIASTTIYDSLIGIAGFEDKDNLEKLYQQLAIRFNLPFQPNNNPEMNQIKHQLKSLIEQL